MKMQYIITVVVGKISTCLLVDDLSIKYNTVREHAFSVLGNSSVTDITIQRFLET